MENKVIELKKIAWACYIFALPTNLAIIIYFVRKQVIFPYIVLVFIFNAFASLYVYLLNHKVKNNSVILLNKKPHTLYYFLYIVFIITDVLLVYFLCLRKLFVILLVWKLSFFLAFLIWIVGTSIVFHTQKSLEKYK